MKGDRIARKSSFGNMVRRRLSDITNFQPHSKSPEKISPDVVSAKDCIDHLVKEKMAMVKLIQDKNKIIELSGIEIQNLRACLQKMQLQNWNLAQSNNHMLAELNMGRERLKALQHEVACKEALLKAKNSSVKGQQEVNVQNTQFQEAEAIIEEPEINENTKCCSAGRRHGRLPRSRSLGCSTMNNQHADKEAVISKRRCLRRQSASSRVTDDEPADNNLFEIDDTKSPVVVVPSTRPTHEARTTSTDEGNYSYISELDIEARRTFIGRPMRKAVEKVQSYKEKPLNVKMRRSQ